MSLPLIVTLSCVTIFHAFGAAARGQGTRADEWDVIFTRQEGWTGADGAGTVALPDGRVLWMFGDTWIGRVADGKHEPGSKLVNITLGIHAYANGSPSPPRSNDVEFVWGGPDAQGHPTAWLRPDESVSGTEKAWFWPMGGGAVTRSSADAGSLVIFLWSVARTPEDRGIWSFRTTGNVAAVIDNWREPIRNWKARQIKIPHARMATESQPGSLEWGHAAVVEQGDSPDRWLFIYGLGQRQAGERDLHVARVPVRLVSDFEQWRFFAGEGRWSERADDAIGIASGMVSEFSIERIGAGDDERWIMVHSEPSLGRNILVRSSRSPTGPWTGPQAVFEVPDVSRNKAYITYAAKGHVMLSAPGELLITYVVNSTDFGAMIADAEIYRPRFVRVPLSALTPP